jgi:hypothetical protein
MSFNKGLNKTISIPKKDFVKEHKHLVKVLRSNARGAELKELKDQAKELREKTGK